VTVATASAAGWGIEVGASVVAEPAHELTNDTIIKHKSKTLIHVLQ
jgi:hypothetical protein